MRKREITNIVCMSVIVVCQIIIMVVDEATVLGVLAAVCAAASLVLSLIGLRHE